MLRIQVLPPSGYKILWFPLTSFPEEGSGEAIAPASEAEREQSSEAQCSCLRTQLRNGAEVGSRDTGPVLSGVCPLNYQGGMTVDQAGILHSSKDLKVRAQKGFENVKGEVSHCKRQSPEIK